MQGLFPVVTRVTAPYSGLTRYAGPVLRVVTAVARLRIRTWQLPSLNWPLERAIKRALINTTRLPIAGLFPPKAAALV